MSSLFSHTRRYGQPVAMGCKTDSYRQENISKFRDFSCTGEESQLFQCSFRDAKGAGCVPNQVAAAVCGKALFLHYVVATNMEEYTHTQHRVHNYYIQRDSLHIMCNARIENQ